MSRVYPIAGVYIITQLSTGLIYIGETKDIQTRFSSYRQLETKYKRLQRTKSLDRYTKIEQAIITNGYDDFKFDIILDEFSNKRLTDTKYRRTVEEFYISKYHSDDERVGYNTLSRNSAINSRTRNINKVGRPHTPGTKIIKSDPILVHDLKDDSVMMFFGKKSFADYITEELGLEKDVDRAIISRAARFGRAYKHFIIFPLDVNKRIEAIRFSITSKLDPSLIGRDGSKYLDRYLRSISRINSWCKQWGYPTVEEDVYSDLLPTTIDVFK